MTLLTNTAEGGSNTTAVTAANSGGASGNAFNSVSGTVTYSTEQASHGALSYKITNASGVAAYNRWDWTNADQVALRFYFRQPAANTVATELANIRNTASNAGVQITVTAANRLTLVVTGPGTLWTSTSTIPVGSWVRVEAGFNRTTSAWRIAYYDGDSTTAVEDQSGTAGTAFTNQFGQLRLGKVSTSATPVTYYYDSIALETANAALLGPVATVATYRASQFLPFF